jgi:hypothetical protein
MEEFYFSSHSREGERREERETEPTILVLES